MPRSAHLAKCLSNSSGPAGPAHDDVGWAWRKTGKTRGRQVDPSHLATLGFSSLALSNRVEVAYGRSCSDMAKPSLVARHMLRRTLRHLDCSLLKDRPDEGAPRLLHHLIAHAQLDRAEDWPGVRQERGQGAVGEADVRSSGSGQIRGWKTGSPVQLGALRNGGSRLEQLRFRTGSDYLHLPVSRGFASGSREQDPGSEADAVASVSGSSSDMKDWLDKLKESAEGAGEKAVEIGAQAWSLSKEASDSLSHVIAQSLQSLSPYMVDTVAPAGVAASLLTCGFAWIMLPRVLRRIHKYTEEKRQGPTARLLGRTAQEVPYELSVWGALEGPARVYLTIITLSYLAAVVAPTSIAAEHVSQISRGATVVAVVWFLHNWKRNVLKRMTANPAVSKAEKERYETLDTLSTIAILLLGGMAFAEACGVAVQSVLTVGGIGGVATAFAAKDLLGNMLSGSALQFGKPFSVGDTIKAGAIEGKVVEMGMHSTQLLTADKSLMIVPNSMFSSQVIVNASRVQFRGLSTRLPLQLQDFDKIPKVTEEIKAMLKSHPKVHLDEEEPRCFVSSVLGNALELTISCNIKPMKKDEFLLVKQEIILEAIRIVSEAGAHMGAFA